MMVWKNNMEIMSWNVNGLRAVVRKGFHKFLEQYNPDILCLQEIKARFEDLTDHHTTIHGYHAYFHSAQKKGYSGVALYSKTQPLSVIEGLGDERFDSEGRVLTAEFEEFFVISCYVPNAQPELARLEYRESFNDALKDFILSLEQTKPVILCGDLNVAHQEIDLKNPKNNRGNPGFSDEERAKLNELLELGFIDTFRHFYPDTIKYSWWSYRFNARANNSGWRIDYILVSKTLLLRIKDAHIYNEIMGSDHCPVSIIL